MCPFSSIHVSMSASNIACFNYSTSCEFDWMPLSTIENVGGDSVSSTEWAISLPLFWTVECIECMEWVDCDCWVWKLQDNENENGGWFGELCWLVWDTIPHIQSIPIPSYSSQFFMFYSHYDTVDQVMTLSDISHCQYSLQLSCGVHFNTSNCLISGVTMIGSPQTTNTMTATVGSKRAMSTVTIIFIDCQDSVLCIVHTYKSFGNKEGILILNRVMKCMLMEVTTGDMHPQSEMMRVH